MRRTRQERSTPYSRGDGADADKWDHSGYETQGQIQRQPRETSFSGSSDDSSSTRVLVDNLKYDVLEDDLEALFSTVGQVEKVKVFYDKSGRSKGSAVVIYKSRHHAEQAVKEYDGRSIEGQPMQVKIGGAVRNQNRGNQGASSSSNAMEDDLNLQIKVSF